MNVIHLLSGGLDSVTMLYDFVGRGWGIRCLLFNYAQPHLKELHFAKEHCARLGVKWDEIRIDPLGGMNEQSAIVPNRNAILLNLAINRAIQWNADAVSIACNKDDEAAFPDCRMAFIQLLNATLITAEIKVHIIAPYMDKKKWEIGAMAKEFGITMDSIWACYKGKVDPCGVCPACEKLQLAGL